MKHVYQHNGQDIVVEIDQETGVVSILGAWQVNVHFPVHRGDKGLIFGKGSNTEDNNMVSLAIGVSPGNDFVTSKVIVGRSSPWLPDDAPFLEVKVEGSELFVTACGQTPEGGVHTYVIQPPVLL